MLLALNACTPLALLAGWTGAGTGGGMAFPDRNCGKCITLPPKAGKINGFVIDHTWFAGGWVHVQVCAQGAGFDNGNNGSIAGNRHGLDLHPYGSAGAYRWEMLRDDTGAMGGYTAARANVYADDASVHEFTGATSAPAPVVGGPLAGALNPLKLTTRRATC